MCALVTGVQSVLFRSVVNPVAKTDPASPIYGMPILDVVDSKNTIVIKRGKGTGFAGIENALFYADNTRMLYGDGAEMGAALVSELKEIGRAHVLTPVTNAHIVCRLLLEKKKK